MMTMLSRYSNCLYDKKWMELAVICSTIDGASTMIFLVERVSPPTTKRIRQERHKKEGHIKFLL